MTPDTEAVYNIISAAGGRLIGKTRLQKTAYILEIAGLGPGFKFSYYHYGPYSSDLVHSIDDAETEGLVQEREEVAQWGGSYSVFVCDVKGVQQNSTFRDIVRLASRSDAVDLELAATAAYLKLQGFHEPWAEVRQRKPEKATQTRVGSAKQLWNEFLKISVTLPTV